MKDLGYKTIFGKEYTHEEALNKSVRDSIVDIIMTERGISEKAFGKVDEVVERVKDEMTPEIYERIGKLYSTGKRIDYIAEMIYDDVFNKIMNESSLITFKTFKGNK